ncbi:MAG TPA: GNAT family N-acetyltransferase [Gammaproteobacteria bacterium]|nr:GNAT family N-acetyltransferase [Gammaproteobacteria bacterium]
MFNINNNFIVQQIKATDDTSKLSLGNQSYTPLKIFLKKNAFDFHQYEIAKTFVLINPELSPTRIWGYLSLMNSEVVLNEKQRPRETLATKRYEAFPAVKIARLAVDKSLHGQGLGRILIEWCMNHLRFLIMPNVGCRFLVVESKRESVGFYQKSGFIILNTESNCADEHPLMYFDMYESNLLEKPNVSHDKLGEYV